MTVFEKWHNLWIIFSYLFLNYSPTIVSKKLSTARRLKKGVLESGMDGPYCFCYSFIMACVLIGIIIEGVNCPLSPSFLFFMALAFINIFGGVLHADFYALICGIVYFLFIPSCFIFLTEFEKVLSYALEFSWFFLECSRKFKKI